MTHDQTTTDSVVALLKSAERILAPLPGTPQTQLAYESIQTALDALRSNDRSFPVTGTLEATFPDIEMVASLAAIQMQVTVNAYKQGLADGAARS